MEAKRLLGKGVTAGLKFLLRGRGPLASLLVCHLAQLVELIKQNSPVRKDC